MQRIYFRDKETNLSQKREGIKVGKYLAVTNDGYIYKIQTGKKLLSCQFSSGSEAYEAAKWLDDLYGKYFILWDKEKWEEINVFKIARHSVENGLEILKKLERLENENRRS